jgi:guanosine-3',5'-bis(diphosphate) 3'-pyrophosphohydrolase
VVEQKSRKPVIRQYELVEKVKLVDPNTDEDLVNKAYVFCMKVHGQQLRASGDPYFFHPLEVANILADMRLDYYSIITALLHDTIEDTLTTFQEIENLFGIEIANLVDGVTKLSKLESNSGSSSQAENFRKLFLAMSKDIRVLLVKLADRVHNMRTLHFIKDPEKRKRIAKETLEIYAPLASRIGITKFRDELENYAFEHLYPQDYQKIMESLANMPHPQRLIEQIIENITDVFEKSGLKVRVYGREKTPYSIWLKIQKRNITFEQLADLMAFRVIVDDLQECYRALGIIHSTYIMVPGRFKDYISTPKANGYQSLHTVVIGPFEQKIEIQIRTKQMHEVCELGVAAHWHYKQHSGNSAGANVHEGSQYSWVRNLLEILEHADSPDEFLEHTKLEMFHDQVFCFTPKGEVIALPKGATILDFAYAIHGAVGNSAVGAKINGKQVPLRVELHNGDQVEILTSKQQKPSPTWERLVITGKAKAQIRKFIRAQSFEQFKELGYKLVKKCLHKYNYHFDEEILQMHAKEYSYANASELLVAIGDGSINPKDLLRLFRQNETAVNDDTEIVSRHEDKAKHKNNEKYSAQIPINGLIPGMAIHYAGCCHPLPGDLIAGVVNTGSGVTIHTQDCSQLHNVSTDCLLDVSWGSRREDNTLYYGRLKIIFANKQGALASITSAISKTTADINNLKVVNRSPDFWEVVADVGVKDREHLQTLQASLRTLKIVSAVEKK